jgi:hypothetical protein
MSCVFTVGPAPVHRNRDHRSRTDGGTLSAPGSSPSRTRTHRHDSLALELQLRNADAVPTLSEPMSRLFLNAYLVPAASRAAGTSRCLWIVQARPSFDPRSGV